MKKISGILTVLGLSLISITWAHTAQAADYSLSQVQTHNTSTDCWTIVNNKVYNLTSFIALHPGGSSAIITLCGTNGTTAFSAQHNTNTSANNTLTSYYIGDLIVLDTTAPAVPTNLTANAISPSQINLTWNVATDNVAVTGYAIFRNNTEIATTTNNAFNNTGLNASSTYNYMVKAFDAAGNRSASSTIVTATTLATSTDTTLPSIPTNLVANVISATQINLNWSTSTDNVAVTGYAVFRNGAEIANVTANNFNNIGLSASTTYNFAVQAFDAAGNRSASSTIVTATTLAAATSTDNISPTAPKKLKAHLISYKHINLEWKKSKDNKKVIGYKIYRNGLEIATVKNDHYNDIGLTPATTYTYIVRAFDKAGNLSKASNTLTVTTRAKKIKENKPVKLQKLEDEDKKNEKEKDDFEKTLKINETKNKINNQLLNTKVDQKKDKKENKK